MKSLGAHLDTRIELAKRIHCRPADNRRVKQRASFGFQFDSHRLFSHFFTRSMQRRCASEAQRHEMLGNRPNANAGKKVNAPTIDDHAD